MARIISPSSVQERKEIELRLRQNEYDSKMLLFVLFLALVTLVILYTTQPLAKPEPTVGDVGQHVGEVGTRAIFTGSTPDGKIQLETKANG